MKTEIERCGSTDRIDFLPRALIYIERAQSSKLKSPAVLRAKITKSPDQGARGCAIRLKIMGWGWSR